MLDDLPEHHTIYECSHLCNCRQNGLCANAVTQRGVITKCSIRWTADRGFGLFAEEDISKGSFLCCYVGEVVSTAEAKRRWAEQSQERHSNYILATKEETNIAGRREILKTTIDARLRGNLGHFLSETIRLLCREWALIKLASRPCLSSSHYACGHSSKDRRHSHSSTVLLRRTRYQERRRIDMGL